MHRIVSATEVGGAGRLESLWLRAFGPGDRAPGWFARKIRREHIDDALSQVAISGDVDPRSPAGWLGLVLVGSPPSLGSVVRTAGTAVIERVRGRGIGRDLLRAAIDAAAHAGRAQLQLVADAKTIAFYERAGFRRVRDVATLEGSATAGNPRACAPVAWDAADGLVPVARELCAWIPEAWHGSDHRCTVRPRASLESSVGELGSGAALVSREGHAWLVHRLLVPSGQPTLERAQPDAGSVRAVAVALLDALPEPAPVLLPFADPVSSITEGFVRAGFRVVQRGALLEHELPTKPVTNP